MTEPSLADLMAQTQAEEEKEHLDWSGDYDGTTCPNCNRQRMMLCTNGKRRCEKCNWDPDAGTYSECPTRFVG